MFPLLSPDPARDFDELFGLLSAFLNRHGVPGGAAGPDADLTIGRDVTVVEDRG